MTKYILNYTGGTKGDFLCNFLNDLPFDINNQNSKSKTNYSYFKSLIWRDFNEKIAVNAITDKKIYPGHCCDKIPKSFLIKNNIKIIDLIYDKSYEKTIKIETIFKNFTNKISSDEKVKTLKSKKLRLSKLEIEQIEYYIDICLLENKKIINDFNRNIFLEYMINEPPTNYKPSDTDIILRYEDIFLSYNFTLLKTYFIFDENLLIEKIKSTWLPEKIECFGKIWIPKDHGYLDFTN